MGSIKQSSPEFRKSMGYLILSLAEVVTYLHKAKNRSYISTELFNQLYKDSSNLMNVMVAFRKVLHKINFLLQASNCQ
ncbi:MAG: four helix bundle protein [Fulvivirga sp.]